MEDNSLMQVESEVNSTSIPFTFSRPNIIPSSPGITNFGVSSECTSDLERKNVFTFAVPTAVSNYKLQISKNTCNPSVNVFAQALKGTAAFEQLKKNSRSLTTKVSLENSITCTNVPKALLMKSSAKEYFANYGHILKIAIRPKKNIITIFYATREQANIAYHQSGHFEGKNFDVHWTTSDMLIKSPIRKKESQKNIVTNLLKTGEEDIKSELEAMSNLEYNLHDKSTTTPLALPVKKNKLLAKNVPKPEKLRGEKAVSKEKNEDSQIAIPLFSASPEELQNIIQQAATTSEDRFKVLEARDRLMRLKQVKSHSLATAKVASGTCPDMCPEKERLMRESQRQVAPYEQLEGSEYKINHATAIKQYSRSSADQEEPMAHELRPVKSLKMTMSYLLHEIADLSEIEGTNLAEWYHFLWDRTRGIRKDITQQELCCTDSVELVEQCARFHIVCSERLCAESLAVFDKKINSENLTKCLQSLKYMYHDLRAKGVTCENEPEFRAYIILLNLNNGNFMWDLQQLPQKIQKSPEVEFAISVYSTLESNNYCKFFKLVRKTTYLNACILLRYFNQVRVKALSCMVKAYCRTTSTEYPLYELIDNLGFEDETEAIYFCEQVGLQTSSDELHVLLNRQNFSQPMSNIRQRRANNMVELKRISQGLSIGQCIAGGKMPEKTYKNHKPHNSFDSQGYLLPESVNAEDQNGELHGSGPFEFTEEPTVILKRSWKTKEESQNSVTKAIVKEKIENTGNQFNPIVRNTTSESANIFRFNKTVTNSPVKCNLQSQNNSNGNVDKDLFSKPLSGQFGLKPNFGVLAKTDPLTERKVENSVFSNTAKVPLVFSSNATTQPAILPKCDTPSQFSMNSKNIFSSGQGNIFSKPTQTFANTSNLLLQQDNDKEFVQQKLKEESFDNLESISKRENSEAEKLRLQEEETKRQQQMEIEAEKVFNDLESEIIYELCSTIMKEEKNKAAMFNALSEKIFTEIFESVNYDICDEILTEEIKNKRRLNEMLQRVKNRITLRCFNAWKSYTYKRKRQREALSDTPVWLQKNSLKTSAELLYKEEQDLVIENMCRRHRKSQVELEVQRNLAPMEIIIYAGIKENLRSLNLDTGVSLLNLFWKLVICWPQLEDKVVLYHCKRIVNEYLNSESTDEPIIKLYKPNAQENLYVCISSLEGLTKEDSLIGTDALLFISLAWEEYKVLSKRLTKTILSREKLMPIPVVIAIIGSKTFEKENGKVLSDLEVLLDAGYISEYTIIFEKNLEEKNILNFIQSAILWLAANKSPPNPLEMDSLQSICDICLTEELWLRILNDSVSNSKLSRALDEPNFIIDLHNEAVAHLTDIILDPESLMYTRFPEEFKCLLKRRVAVPISYEYFDDSWKTEEYRAKLESVMNQFILPHWSESWPISDTQTFHRSITNYCQDVLSDSNSNIVSCDILSKIFLATGTLQVTSFVDILLYVIKEKIQLLSEDLNAVYNKNHIKHFRTLPWWFKSNVLMDYVQEDNDINGESASKRQKMSSDEPNYDPLEEYCRETDRRILDVYSASKEIEDRMYAQRTKSQLLEKKLQDVLNSDFCILK